MKKTYTKPEFDVVVFNHLNIIATSEIPISEDIEHGVTYSPRHNVIWEE
jgi:hypothetical protein